MAAHQKKASRLGAWLAFLDESGLLMAPLVRRSWSLRGHTPILRQRTRHHQKVSILAALCVSPDRKRVQLYFRLYPNLNVNGKLVAEFLHQLQRQLSGPVMLIWDRFGPHRARCVQRVLETRLGLRSVFLPPYAPELNPPEYLWSYLKRNPLANLALEDAEALRTLARRHARGLQRSPSLLCSFLRHSPLSLRLK